jgi:hypothetical protein
LGVEAILGYYIEVLLGFLLYKGSGEQGIKKYTLVVQKTPEILINQGFSLGQQI